MCKEFNVKADHVWKSYIKVPSHAKDFINALLYDGNNKHLSLSLTDSEETGVINEKNPLSLERRRDAIFIIEDQGVIGIIGIENQGEEDESMVIRNLIYDGMNYLNQYLRVGKIKQVITVVLNFSEDEWKSPRDLKGLIGETVIEKLFNNWSIPVYNVKDLDENLFQDKDNQDLIRGIKKFYNSSWSKEEVENFVYEVNREVAIVVASVTGCQELQEVIKEMKGETINMCRGFRMYTETIQKESEEIGYNKGKNDGISQGIEQSFINLLNNGIQFNNALEWLNIPLKEYEYYKEKYSQ